MAKKVKVSQKKIALDLGISQTLVSMVLNGRRAGVSKETYQQIWDHARKVGYHPKGMDPELLRKNGTVATAGFVLRSGVQLNSQSPFFGHVQDGLHEYLASQGIALVFLGSEERLDIAKLQELYTQRGGFQGVVILGEVSRAFLHSVKQIEPRLVMVSAQYPGLCHSVVYNEEQAAELIVEHLTALGHRDFAWLGGNRGHQRVQKRFAATEAALKERKLILQPGFITELEGGNRIEGRQAAEQILKAAGKKSPPTAWICYNGLIARGAANFLLQNGVRIPGDVSVAAFDRTRICTEESPTLTGAGADPEEMGRLAGRLLISNSEAPEGTFSDCVLPSALTERESTGPAPQR